MMTHEREAVAKAKRLLHEMPSLLGELNRTREVNVYVSVPPEIHKMTIDTPPKFQSIHETAQTVTFRRVDTAMMVPPRALYQAIFGDYVEYFE